MISNEDELRKKVSENLNNLNKSTSVYNDMINDYIGLFKMYQTAQEQLNKKGSGKSNTDNNVDKQKELEKEHEALKKEYFDLKAKYEDIQNQNNDNLQKLIQFKDKLDINSKKITGYQAENSALKQQNRELDKQTKELTKTKESNEAEIFNLKKRNQKLEVDHGKLLDYAGKIKMEAENLRSKLLELQESAVNKTPSYNDIIESALQKNLGTYNKELSKIILNSDEAKIPRQLKFKQKDHFEKLTTISFNKSFSQYATGGDDKSIHVYDPEKKSEIFSFTDCGGEVTEVCFDCKEQYLFVALKNNTAKLYEISGKKLVATFEGHKGPVLCAKTFYTKQKGITGSSDKTIKKWDFQSKKVYKSLATTNICCALALSEDDKIFFCGNKNGTVSFWNNVSNKLDKEINRHKEEIIDIKIIKDNLLLTLSKDRHIKLYDIKKQQDTFDLDENIIPEICEASIGVSPDKKFFALGSQKGIIYIVNLNDGNVVSNINNGNCVIKALYWKNTQLYVGDVNGFLSIWGTAIDI